MIKLASPDIRENDIKKAATVLKSGNLIQGDNIASFERDLQYFTKLPFATVVSSGTAALHTALLAFDLPKKCGVIVPAFTFPATANAVIHAGYYPVLCDIDVNSYVITPEAIEKTIKKQRDKKIGAIIIVHEFGFPVEIKKIAKIAKIYNLRLIEDAACALGTKADNHSPGYYSDAACYSFHPRKAITTGEGGAILTNSKTLAYKCKLLRNHGMDPVKNYDFIYAGLNYRMTDFQAVLGREQLKRFNVELHKRKQLVKIYYQFLKNQNKIKLPVYIDSHSWQSFMIVLDPKIDRSILIKRLLSKGIQTNYGAQALNCLSYFRKNYGYTKNDFQVASRLYEHGLVLPLYGKLSPMTIKKIARTIIREITHA